VARNGERHTVLAIPTYDLLKERIMDQALAPGARLNIEAVAAELGVSPTPVREALARLAAEHLVTFVSFKGYTVTPLLTHRRLGELMHVRRLLEVDAARQAAVRVVLPQLRRMERELDTIAALRPEPRFKDYRPYNEHDQAFHEILVGAADNAVLLETYQSLSAHAQLARLYHGRGEIDYTESLAEHCRIYETLCVRDPDAVAAAVGAHINGVERRLGEFLDDD
jgi:DNA-binding GntR family transcriptional regulator